MRAAVCRQFGPPESIAIVDDYPAPALNDGHCVRVRVGAAAVNFPDVLFMANQYQMTVPVPFIPGSEFAGVVTEAGEKVREFAPGARVMGTTMVGAFAEEVVVASRSLSLIPDGVSAEAAAAFGVAHRTAYHALRTIAEVTPGERLVVLGAGGGVGLAVVQLGVILGLDVTAVASSDEKLAVAASCGAARGINHKTADLRKALKDAFPDGTDVVIDPVGGDLAEAALRSLRWACCSCPSATRQGRYRRSRLTSSCSRAARSSASRCVTWPPTCRTRSAAMRRNFASCWPPDR